MATISLWVQPRASRTEIAGRHGEAIRLRVAAPPVEGAANDEIIRFLARALGVPRSAVVIRRGTGSRRKDVTVAGLSAREIEERLLPS